MDKKANCFRYKAKQRIFSVDMLLIGCGGKLLKKFVESF